MAERSRGAARQEGELFLYRTPVPDPVVWNGALLLSAPQEPIRLLEQADCFFDDREAYGFWVVGSEDSEMADLLDRRDAPAIDNAPLMVAATEAVSTSATSDLTIETVADERGRQAFVAVSAVAFETIGAAATSWPAVYPDVESVAGRDIVTVVARRDGRAVAAGMGYLHADVCQVIHIGTSPDSRRQGLGAAVTAAVVGEARTRGARYAVLQATEFGESVYRALGFAEVDHYMLHLRRTSKS